MSYLLLFLIFVSISSSTSLAKFGIYNSIIVCGNPQWDSVPIEVKYDFVTCGVDNVVNLQSQVQKHCADKDWKAVTAAVQAPTPGTQFMCLSNTKFHFTPQCNSVIQYYVYC